MSYLPCVNCGTICPGRMCERCSRLLELEENIEYLYRLFLNIPGGVYLYEGTTRVSLESQVLTEIANAIRKVYKTDGSLYPDEDFEGFD